MNDPLTRFALLGESGREGMRRRLSEYTGTLLFALCLLLTAVMPLVLLRPVNPLSRDFVSRTLYSLLTSTLTYLIFLPEGRRSEEERSPRYRELDRRLSSLSAPILRVGAGLLAPFRAFCRAEEERQAEEGRRRRLSLAGFEPEPDLASLTRRERRRFRRLAAAKRSVRLPFEAMLSSEEEAAPTASGLSYGAKVSLRRPLVTLLSSVLLASFEVIPSSLSGKEALVKIALSALSVLFAAFSGFSAGVTDRRERGMKCERRILFLTAFYEAEGLSLPNCEKSA